MAAKQKVCLVTIDPQNDFVNRDGKGTLAVPGAVADMDRIAKMIDKNGDVIDDIQITMDSHYHVQIFHSCWWIDKKGKNPNPFTLIDDAAVDSGDFRAYDPERQDWSKSYVKALKANKRYVLCIWPDHCIIGSNGQALDPVFLKAVTDWETRFYATAPRTTKGSNPFTEHYSAVKADVEYPGDPKTRLNSRLIDTLKEYDIILATGEALSHCLNFTMGDIAEEFGDAQVKKIVLLEDAASNVPGFEKMGEDFVNRMVAKGMQISKTTTFFK
jgi:nicotinamidase/pyrazinamidase